MKKSVFFILSMTLISVCLKAESKIIAFPGADGAGKYATGGRGGQTVFVTNLSDDVDSVGSFRWALQQKSPKNILFKVAGIIHLKSDLKVKHPNVTIYGQSAPGDGICISGYPFYISADNVIIRFLRFRMGDVNRVQDDALKGNNRKNIIIDHCSMSWSIDECSSFYDNADFTMQWCIISESLRNSYHDKGIHGYGGIWGGEKASFHHNLLADHDSRNPRFCGSRYTNDPQDEKVDFRNNVIYNWGINSGYAAEGGTYNIVNNYYKPGPATYAKKGKSEYRIFAPNADDGKNKQPKGVWGKFYVAGNIMYGNEKVTGDNMLGFQLKKSKTDTCKKADIISKTEFPYWNSSTESAVNAYKDVLAKAGASYVRDNVDKRIVDEVKTGTYKYEGSKGSTNGLIDSQNDVGGWPVYSYNPKNVLKDSDNDGMPDAWEIKNKLNPHDARDAREYTLNPHYTNLEVYLNSIVSNLY